MIKTQLTILTNIDYAILSTLQFTLLAWNVAKGFHDVI